MNCFKTGLLVAAVCGVSGAANAAVLSQWTFETSVPTTAGPHVAETGVFAGNATSNSGGTLSNPAGNGSAESFSSNGWNAGEYYQFSTSTTGYKDITISFAQAASNTGPQNFQFQYSTDGINYLNFGSSYVGPTPDFDGSAFKATNVLSYNLTSITALNEKAAVGFRVAVVGSTAENDGTIASGGTFRIDDFTVNGNLVPEPGSLALLGLGGLLIARRRRSA